MSSQQIQALESEKIPKLLFHYALPAVVGTAVNSLYNIVDRIFIACLNAMQAERKDKILHFGKCSGQRRKVIA